MSRYYAPVLPGLVGTTVTTYDDVPPDVAPTDSWTRCIPRLLSRAKASTHSAFVARSPSSTHTNRPPIQKSLLDRGLLDLGYHGETLGGGSFHDRGGC